MAAFQKFVRAGCALDGCASHGFSIMGCVLACVGCFSLPLHQLRTPPSPEPKYMYKHRYISTYIYIWDDCFYGLGQ